MNGAREEFARLRTELSARGFAARVGFGLRPALIVVDMIEAFTDPASPLGSNLDAVVASIAELLATARLARIPILFSTVSYDAQLLEAGIWIRKIPATRCLVTGSSAVRVDARLSPHQNEHLIVKKYASCFFGTDLATRLLVNNVDTLIVAGCTTSGCVRATAVDACSYGLRALIVEEAVGDRFELCHLASLFDIESKYGDVIHLPDTTAYLRELRNQAHEITGMTLSSQDNV